jgi:hypothetical protein
VTEAPTPVASEQSISPQTTPAAGEGQNFPALAGEDHAHESADALSPAQPPPEEAAQSTRATAAISATPPEDGRLNAEQENLARALAEEVAAVERERADSLARELARVRQELDILRAKAVPSWFATPELPNAPVAENPAEATPLTMTPMEAAFLGQQGTAPTNPEPSPPEPPVPPAPATPPPATSPSPSNQAAQRSVQRAEALLTGHDISGARLLLERAVELGSARAAYLLAQTYDPRILDEWRIKGVRGDPAKAAEYYVRAQAGGVAEAGDRLPRR